jgi:hypothetical protein
MGVFRLVRRSGGRQQFADTRVRIGDYLPEGSAGFTSIVRTRS